MGTLYYQVTHARRVRLVKTDYHLFPDEWDARQSVALEVRDDRCQSIRTIRAGIRGDISRFSQIIRRLDISDFLFSTDDVVREYRRYCSEYTLFNFMRAQISRLKDDKRIRTSETYAATLASFSRFRQDRDIMLDCLNSDIMESYQAWLKHNDLTLNTISFYMRILRAVYNRAVGEDIIDDRHPFRKVYTGIDKTVKRALPASMIRKIRNLDLHDSPELDFARDMFMMSFYLRGMSFIDMAFLRKSDLRNGFVSYKRHKVGCRLTIAWTSEMQAILNKYPANDTPYLLPVIRKTSDDERTLYLRISGNVNQALKKIAVKAGIHCRLTMYVARHSWASVARVEGIPLGVIAEGMGHGSESTTRIYLASLDSSVIDRANTKIMRALR